METPDYERKKKKKKHSLAEPELNTETPKRKKKKLLESCQESPLAHVPDYDSVESPRQKSPKKKNNNTTDIPNNINISWDVSDDDTFISAKLSKSKKNVEEPLKFQKKIKSPSKAQAQVEEEEVEEAIDDMFDEKEHEEVVDHDVDVPRVAQDGSEMFMGWEKSELVQLFDQMKAQIPKNDALRFQSRVKKIDWKKVVFGGKTEEECKKVWDCVQLKMRNFRLLDEVLVDARNWADTPWRNMGHGKKVLNHPDMPKKPLSAFFIFLKAKLPKYRTRFPDLPLVQVTKLLSQKYKELPEERKSKYTQKAESLKAEYAQKFEEFKKAHPTAIVKKPPIAKKEKPVKSPKQKRPKPPQTPFKLFVVAKVGEYKHDRAEELKEVWKNLNERKKIPFIKKALEEEGAYLEHLKEFFEENPNVEFKKAKPAISKEERRILDKAEGKPEDPPTSSFMLYKNTMLQDLKMKEKFPLLKDRVKEVCQLWHSISDSEKQIYHNQFKKMKEEFVVQYKKYLDTLPEEKRLLELAQGKLKRVHALDEFSSGGKFLKQKTISEMLYKAKPEKPVDVKSKEEEDEEEEEEDDRFVSDYESGDDGYIEEIKEKIIAKEPLPPPSDPFEYFKSTVKDKIQSEKKLTKLWDRMNPHDKLKYKQKLAEVKQIYLLDYRTFLKSLNEKEIAVFNDLKKSRTVTKPTNDSSDDDADDSDEKEQIELPVQSPTKKQVSSPVKAKPAPAPPSSEDSDSS